MKLTIEVDESEVRFCATQNPDRVSAPLLRAIVVAAREAFPPPPRFEVGKPYEVTFISGSGRSGQLKRVLYRVEDGWTYDAAAARADWSDEEIAVHDVHKVTIGEAV